MKIKEILDITKGIIVNGEINDKDYHDFNYDSRKITSGEVFFAIKTEKRDGNSFIYDASNNGAEICIVDDDSYIKEPISSIIIKVDNVLSSIKKIGNYNRNKFGKPLIAITGSVGKTTAKELVTKVLEKKYTVLSSSGNYNNEIGLPIVLLKEKEEHDLVVVEIGMNHKGELEDLSKICEPNVGVIVNIGTAHIGNLGSKEKIKEAKLEIIKGFKENAVLFLNGDDEYLNQDIPYDKIIYYSKKDRKLEIENLEQYPTYNKFNIVYSDNSYEINLNVPGNMIISNVMLAIKLGLYFDVDMRDIVNAINSYKTMDKRLNTFKIGSATIIDDSYNASTISMMEAIDILSFYNKKKIAVLGDMLEMGDYSVDEHKKIGEYLKTKNIDIVITKGEYSKYIDDNNFNTNEEIEKYIKENKFLEEDCVILFKGSNGMRLFDVIEKLKNGE